MLSEPTPAHVGLGLISCSWSACDLGAVLQQDEVKGVRPGSWSALRFSDSGRANQVQGPELGVAWGVGLDAGSGELQLCVGAPGRSTW